MPVFISILYYYYSSLVDYDNTQRICYEKVIKKYTYLHYSNTKTFVP